MPRIDFTSGEKRGLIALLALITAALLVSIMLRLCDRDSGDPTDPADSGNVATDTTVTVTATVDTMKVNPTTVKTKKKKKAAKQLRPDGRQRSFLDETVEQ